MMAVGITVGFLCGLVFGMLITALCSATGRER